VTADGSVVQEELLAAASLWSAEAYPDNPRGWLIRMVGDLQAAADAYLAAAGLTRASPIAATWRRGPRPSMTSAPIDDRPSGRRRTRPAPPTARRSAPPGTVDDGVID
jgi:hypothetical protein